MKKNNNKGFMLAETLIVTTFVAVVLIFLYVQFTSLSNSYKKSYKYNTVEGLYAVEDIINYIMNDELAYNYIETNIDNSNFIDITDCSIFLDEAYCSKLFELENIDRILVAQNNFNYNLISNDYNKEFMDFIEKITGEGKQKYRIIASFKNSTYTTIRFGD